jgi:uncharacterized protein
VSALDAVVLVLAAFAAGVINAVAGGGSLMSFPVLMAIGYGAKVANVTNTVAIWPWSLGGSWAYRYELSMQPGNLRLLALPTVLGALAGSAVLLSTPEAVFEDIVPALLVGACALLAVQDRLSLWALRHPFMQGGPTTVLLLQAAIFAASVYGAYFGAGLGIIVLALLGLLLPDDIQRSNALKGLIAMVVNGVAAVYFAIFADVAWDAAAIMAASALAGGYSGVAIARRLPRGRLRQAVIAFGLVAAAVLFAGNLLEELELESRRRFPSP